MGTTPVTIAINGTETNLTRVSDLTVAIRNGGSLLPMKTAEALDRLDASIQKLSSTLAGISGVVDVPVVSAPVTIQEVTAVNGTTTDIVPSVAASVGAILVVFVNNDSTAGLHQITWDASGGTVKWATVNIPQGPSLQSAFMFVGRTTIADSVVRWYCVPEPQLGQTA